LLEVFGGAAMGYEKQRREDSPFPTDRQAGRQQPERGIDADVQRLANPERDAGAANGLHGLLRDRHKQRPGPGGQQPRPEHEANDRAELETQLGRGKRLAWFVVNRREGS
jgi:hypothetical protein